MSIDPFSTSSVNSVLGDVTSNTNAANVAAVASAQQNARLKKQLNQLSDSYSGQFRDIGDQLNQIQNVQSSIASGISSLQAGKASVDSLYALFQSMNDLLTDAQNPANAAGAAQAFQAKMMTLRSMTSHSDGNLLSGADQRVTYTATVSGTDMTFTGRHMGSEYTIAASDGNVWAPNDSGSALTAYSTYPNTPAGKSSSFGGATILNSQSGTAINFTVNALGATPQTLTGTFTGQGVGVYDSWLYDELSTPEGIARAQKDVAAAMGAAEAEQYRYASAIDIATYYSSKADLDASTLTNKQQSLTEEQALKAADLQDKFKQAQNSLSLAMQAASNASSAQIQLLPAASGIFTPDDTSNYIDIFA